MRRILGPGDQTHLPACPDSVKNPSPFGGAYARPQECKTAPLVAPHSAANLPRYDSRCAMRKKSNRARLVTPQTKEGLMKTVLIYVDTKRGWRLRRPQG